MTVNSTYLDNNATTPLRPEVLETMARALAGGGNASSVHASGRKARALVEQARRSVAALVHAREDEIIFTSGGTEADNLVIDGLVGSGRARRLVISSTEHPAIVAPARRAGVPLEVIAVDGDGVIDSSALARHLEETGGGDTLVSVIFANNETGVIQPIAEIAELVHAHGALIHSDATQAAGKIAVDFAALGLDALTLSSHKLAGPQGAGALVLRDGMEIAPLLAGGGQEKGRRGGTENVAGIAGFGKAAELAAGSLADFAKLAGERDRFEKLLVERWPDACVFGRAAPRLPNTSCFAIPGASAEMLLIALDLDGIAVSSGAACSSGKVAASPVLEAMGVAPQIAAGAVRMSLGWANREGDIERLVAGLDRALARRRAGNKTAAA